MQGRIKCYNFSDFVTLYEEIRNPALNCRKIVAACSSEEQLAVAWHCGASSGKMSEKWLNVCYERDRHRCLKDMALDKVISRDLPPSHDFYDCQLLCTRHMTHYWFSLLCFTDFFLLFHFHPVWSTSSCLREVVPTNTAIWKLGLQLIAILKSII